MVWSHVYDPFGSPLLSTLVAMLPLVVLLGLLAFAGWTAQRAAVAGLATALAIAIGAVGMPADAACAAALHGVAFGLFPIGWIIVTAMFLYCLSVEAGALEIMKRSVARLSADHRVQALLTGAGFPALEAACLALIANTAFVAFGALGTPIVTLAKVTGVDGMHDGGLARARRRLAGCVRVWGVVRGRAVCNRELHGGRAGRRNRRDRQPFGTRALPAGMATAGLLAA